MKSSQSKANQSSSTSDSSSTSSSRNRDESLTSRRDQQQNEPGQVPGQVEDIRGRNEFANLQDQGQQGQYNPSAAESYSSYEGINQPQYGQQQYGQESSNFRRQGNQPYQQQQQQPYQQSQFSRQNEMPGQSGISALVDAWTGLVLGQVQIATQAAIRLAQCCFSPSLISGISEVQRRYAEDSISSASAAASRLAQFTPRALNQNQPFAQQQPFAQSQQYGQGQNQPYNQQGQQFGQSAYSQSQDYGQQQQRQQQYG